LCLFYCHSLSLFPLFLVFLHFPWLQKRQHDCKSGSGSKDTKIHDDNKTERETVNKEWARVTGMTKKIKKQWWQRWQQK
jgi:hypothetical protein